jgi:hypothetical protein
MTYFPDLSPYTYLDEASTTPAETGALNVGWLAEGHEYARGSVGAGVIEGLYRALEHEVNVTRGIHYCEFCNWGADPPFPYAISPVTGKRHLLGNSEIRVVGADGTVYAAPTWVVHYVAAHQYRPPEEFCEAAVLVPPLT